MTPEDLQTLSILDAIGLNSKASQRELSRVTGLNLSKVNFLLRRLAERGQIKLNNISNSPNKLKYLYILTPRGLAEKSRLTLQFAARTLREYSKTVDQLRQNLDQLAESGITHVILLGTTKVTEIIIDVAEQNPNIEVVGIIAPDRSGDVLNGVPVYANTTGLTYGRAIPCDDSEIGRGKLAKTAGIPEDKIWFV